ncbi:MAG: hypothetical protein AAF184_20345 [Pseudomonadota bacterium]
MNSPTQSPPAHWTSQSTPARRWRGAKLPSLVAVALLAAVAGCNSDSDEIVAVVVADDPPPDDAVAAASFQELYDQGVDRYESVFAPMASTLLSDGTITYTFDGSDNGPMCFTGGEFTMTTRDGSASELMIFVQGGGACSENNCDAVDVAPPRHPRDLWHLGRHESYQPRGQLQPGLRALLRRYLLRGRSRRG